MLKELSLEDVNTAYVGREMSRCMLRWVCKVIHSTRQRGQLCMGGLLHEDENLLGTSNVSLRTWWDFYELGIATAISEQASTDSGPTGLQLRALFSPEARRLPRL